MHILVTGGSGFLGTALIKRLLADQHALTVISRHPDKFPIQHPSLQVIHLSQLGLLLHADSVINLAGAGIADSRWTVKRKKILLQSRLHITQALIDWFTQLDNKPGHFLSGSAIGWYGDHQDHIVTENSQGHAGFTHELCQHWEQCASQAKALGIVTTLLRTGVVLDSEGGMLKRLKPVYELGLGGKIGSGQQWLSWISRNDWVSAVLFLMQFPIEGAVNLVAPQTVTQQEFAKNFASSLQRPALMPMPTPIAKVVFGEMAHLFLDSQKIIPHRLTESGFQFQDPNLVNILTSITK